MNFARIWCITNPTPARRVTPPWNVYMAKFDPGSEGYPVWQTGLPALAGHPTYHVNVIKLKTEIIWTGGLPPLSGLPHLPGVPNLHINRPLFSQFRPRHILQAIACCLFINYACICTWMHVNKTTFERNSSLGSHHVVWKGKQTKKVSWKSGSVKYCWRIEVHYGLGENGE